MLGAQVLSFLVHVLLLNLTGEVLPMIPYFDLKGLFLVDTKVWLNYHQDIKSKVE